MNRLWKLTRGVAAAAMLALPSFAGSPDGMAVAQESVAGLEEVMVIEAPLARRQDGWTTGGLPVEIIEVKRRVSYADLDLSKEADVTAFKTRIQTAAQISCEELAASYPVSFTGRWAIAHCTDEALHRSEKQIQNAIAAAH